MMTFTAHTYFEASGFPALEPRWRVFWYGEGEFGPELQEWNESGTSSVSPPIPFEHFGPVLAVVNCGTSQAMTGVYVYDGSFPLILPESLAEGALTNIETESAVVPFVAEGGTMTLRLFSAEYLENTGTPESSDFFDPVPTVRWRVGPDVGTFSLCTLFQEEVASVETVTQQSSVGLDIVR